MLIRNVTEFALYAALTPVSEHFGRNVGFIRTYPAYPGIWAVALRAQDTAGPGHSIDRTGRRQAAACGHVWRMFLENLPAGAEVQAVTQGALRNKWRTVDPDDIPIDEERCACQHWQRRQKISEGFYALVNCPDCTGSGKLHLTFGFAKKAVLCPCIIDRPWRTEDCAIIRTADAADA